MASWTDSILILPPTDLILLAISRLDRVTSLDRSAVDSDDRTDTTSFCQPRGQRIDVW